MKKGSIISPDEIHIEIKISNDPVFVSTFHRGGMKAFRNNDPHVQCTTAWSVTGQFGDGILTAGHCDHDIGGLGNYQVNHFPMYRQDYVYAPWTQDAAYYVNSPFQAAVPKFYADVNDVRAVRNVRSTNSMVGSYVCRFGRVSNFRSCNHMVVSTNTFMSIGDNSGHLVYPYVLYPMVKVTNNTSVGGDSGGGWSVGYSAWGVQSGASGDGSSFSFFSDIQRIESSLGITVKTVPF